MQLVPELAKTDVAVWLRDPVFDDFEKDVGTSLTTSYRVHEIGEREQYTENVRDKYKDRIRILN